MTLPLGLYVVGTPIGNLQDMTPRALETLRHAPIIACEDTRRTQQLLRHFGITGKRLLRHDLANEHYSAAGLVQCLQHGQSVACVSDSGMPTISDPGFMLVQAAIAAGFTIFPVAGVAAVTTALAGAGLPASRFVFLGFLPRKAGEQRKILQRFCTAPEALVIYEAPNRIGKTCALAQDVLGNRPACLCRELTKQHEEFIRLPLHSLAAQFAEAPAKGECTLIIAGDTNA